MASHRNGPLPPPPGEIVNVKSFGAVGDGKTDDTAAVAAAVKYVKAQVHRPVLRFPAGVFVLFERRPLQKNNCRGLRARAEQLRALRPGTGR